MPYKDIEVYNLYMRGYMRAYRRGIRIGHHTPRGPRKSRAQWTIIMDQWFKDQEIPKPRGRHANRPDR
jgi:hypothetical protein